MRVLPLLCVLLSSWCAPACFAADDVPADWTMALSDAPHAERRAALGRLARNEALRDRVIALMRGRDGARTAPLCGEIASEATADLLVATLRSEHIATRIAAIRALAMHRVHHERVVPALVARLPKAGQEEARQLLRAGVWLKGIPSRTWLRAVALGPQLELLASVFDPAFRIDVVRALLAKLPSAQPALARLTGEDLGDDPSLWLHWLAHRPQRSGGPVEGGVPVPTKPTGPTFFGITIARSDVVFLLDASSSMARRGQTGPTLFERVQRQTLQLLKQFASTNRFNLIFFADKPRALDKRLVAADAARRDKARRLVERARPAGRTHLERGLRAALTDPRVKEIVLLTDGLPTHGKVRTAKDALKLIGDRAVRVHLLVTSAASRGLFDLATKTGGRLRKIAH